MDGNGRWAKARNLPRTEGHARGEDSLFDVIAGAIEVGVRYLSAYAFSTENWSRSPDEVRWLMGFNRDVIRRRRDQLDAMGVRVRWAGRRPRLWRSVINELEDAEQRTLDNDVLTLQFCVNYGGRAEIVDAARRIAELAAAGRLDPAKLTEDRFRQFLDEPDIPDVDLFVRSSGEQRTSNFLLWQSAYAEMVFLDRLWPDFDRRDLWRAIELYADRDRRYGGAVPNQTRGRRRTQLRRASVSPATGSEESAVVAGAEDLQVVADVAEAVLGGHRVGPLLHRRPGDLDRPAAATADQMVVVAGRAAPVGRLAVARSAARPARRPRPSPAGCGRPWSARSARPTLAQVVVDLLRGAELVTARPGCSSTAVRWRVRRCGGGGSVGRCSRCSSVLVVVVGVGRVPVTLVEVVGVVAVLDRDVAAAGTVLVRVPSVTTTCGASVVVVVEQLGQHGRHSTSPGDQQPRSASSARRPRWPAPRSALPGRCRA